MWKGRDMATRSSISLRNQPLDPASGQRLLGEDATKSDCGSPHFENLLLNGWRKGPCSWETEPPSTLGENNSQGPEFGSPDEWQLDSVGWKHLFLSFSFLSSSFLFFFLFLILIYLFYVYENAVADTPEEGIRFHYRWLWATMWLLGFEFRTFRRAVSALNRWAISPTTSLCFSICILPPQTAEEGIFKECLLRILNLNKNPSVHVWPQVMNNKQTRMVSMKL